MLSFLLFLKSEVLVVDFLFVGLLLLYFSFCLFLHFYSQLLISAVFLVYSLLRLLGFPLLFLNFSFLLCQVSQMLSFLLFFLSFKLFLFLFFSSFRLLNLLFELFLDLHFSLLFDHMFIDCLVFQF